MADAEPVVVRPTSETRHQARHRGLGDQPWASQTLERAYLPLEMQRELELPASPLQAPAAAAPAQPPPQVQDRLPASPTLAGPPANDPSASDPTASDRPLSSYGDLLAERQQRHYAIDAEYRQFWREEQQRILKFGVGPVMDAIDLVRAPFQGRWRDAAWDALSLLGGKLFGAAGKWLAVSGLVARPVYQGVKLATPLGETTGFHSFRAFKKARGPAGKDMQWHHIVEQNPTNRARFQAEWLHSDLNVIRLDSATHTKISAVYSGRGTRPGMRFRDEISELPYEDQYKIGAQILRDHGVNIP